MAIITISTSDMLVAQAGINEENLGEVIAALNSVMGQLIAMKFENVPREDES